MRVQGCVLCGRESTDVEMALVDWKDAERRPFDRIPRCRDRQECRGRVELPPPRGLGESWPIRDSTFPVLPMTDPPAVVEPVDPPADEEAPSWL